METVHSCTANPGAPLRVLIVDDEKNIRVTLGAYLEGMGCRVMAVGAAGAALSAWAAVAPVALAALNNAAPMA